MDLTHPAPGIARLLPGTAGLRRPSPWRAGALAAATATLVLAPVALRAQVPDAGSATTALPVTDADTVTDPARPVARDVNQDLFEDAPPAEDTGESIVRIELGRYLVSEATLAYRAADGEVMLPIGELAQVLDFAIEMDTAAGVAKGWIVREGRDFELDLAQAYVVYEGRREAIPAGVVRLGDGEIYVSAAALSRWWPLDISFDPVEQLVSMKARETLPFELALQRDERLRRFGGGRRAEGPNLPRAEAPYQLATLPYVDLSFDARASTEGEGNDRTLGALFAGDLLYMGASGFVGIENESRLDQSRFKLERKDADAAALGPWAEVTEFALGDLGTSRLPLISDGATGLGVTLSNQPLNRVSELDRIRIEGPAPVGWDIELYRNGDLLDFGLATPDGRYEFADVPLVLGPNDLLVVLLGPQGQRREFLQQFFAGPGLIETGQTLYRVFAGRHEERLVPEDQTFDREGAGLDRHIVELEHGLRRGLSVAAAAARLPVDGMTQDYASLGLRGQRGGVFGRVDLAKRRDQGEAVELAALTRLGGVSLSMSHAQYQDFSSEFSVREGQGLRGDSRVRADGSIGLANEQRIGASAEARYQSFAGGRSRIELDNRLSGSVRGLFLAHSLDARINTAADAGSSTQIDGELLSSGRVRDWGQLRVSGSYRISPQLEPSSVTVSLNRGIDERRSIRSEISQAFTDGQDSSLLVSLIWRGLKMIGSLGGGYSSQDGLIAQVNLSTSFGLDPESNGLLVRSQGLASSGLIHARTFLDENGDGVRTDTELGLEEVRFRGLGSRLETGRLGGVALAGGNEYLPTPVTLDDSSLVDPFWVPTTPGYEVVSRPGRVTRVDFAVVPTGEADGTAFLDEDGRLKPVANVQLLLESKGSERIYEARSTFDGFFLFEKVLPGEYFLGVSTEQAQRLKLEVPPSQKVLIRGTGDVVSGIQMVLRRAAGEATEATPEIPEIEDLQQEVPAAPVMPAAALEPSPASPDTAPAGDAEPGLADPPLLPTIPLKAPAAR